MGLSYPYSQKIQTTNPPAPHHIVCLKGLKSYIAKLSQAPAQLSGAELALFLENPDHPPTRRPPAGHPPTPE